MCWKKLSEYKKVTIDAKKLKKKQYKRLLLRFENLHPIEKNHRPFSQIVNSYYEMGGITGEVIISLGRGRRKSGLNQEKVPQMLEDIYENQDILSDAALKVKDDDDDSVDIINLFDNALCSYIDFQLEKRTVLDFGYATNLMVDVYEGNKGEIEQLIS